MTMPEDLSFFCSVYSANMGEQLWGTAPRADVWLALEYPHPWGAEALAESSIPAPVKAQLAAILKARVQLIRQSERVEDGIAFFVAAAGRLYRFQLGAYEELLALDLAGIIAGAPDYERFLSDESLFLVCVNGKRDKCCTKYGLPVYEALSRAAGQAVWQCSHLAGHRFAATCVILPQGLVYGRLTPDETATLIASHRRGEIMLEYYRGNAGYDEPAQAAEYYLRAQTGNRDIGAVRLIEIQSEDKVNFRAYFESDGKRHIIDLARQQSAFDLIKSCKEAKGAPRPQYTLVNERNE
jgi:hypothetical protein